MKRILILVAGMSLGGCTLDVCAEHPPSFELEIMVDDEVEQAVRSLTVEVSWLENRFERHYVIGDALDDGLTSIGVELDPKPVDEVDATVAVRGFAGEEATTELIAEDEETYEVSPDGCNLFPIDIDPLEAPNE